MTNIKHSSKNQRWFTPLNIVESARLVLGGVIDLDPASEEFGNSRIKAARFIIETEDALHPDTRWATQPVSVFLNSPGGRSQRTSIPVLFWQKLMCLRDVGLIKHAIVIGFSLEFLQTSQDKGVLSGCDFVQCIPKKRMKFDLEGSVKKTSPTHSNCIIYVPGLEDKTEAFANEFRQYGTILAPYKFNDFSLDILKDKK